MVPRKPSPDELALWDKVTADAEPLESDQFTSALDGIEPEAAPTRAKVKTAKPKKSAPKPAPRQDVPVAPAVSFPAALEEHMPGRTPGLDRRAALRLRRGQTEIDGRIDLHGMTQAEAHTALNGYLASSQRAGRRCILVITGKGGRETDNPDSVFTSRTTGVLKRALPKWLRESPNKERVLAFNPAQPRHGGDGAWYVLLRRPRDKKPGRGQ